MQYTGTVDRLVVSELTVGTAGQPRFCKGVTQTPHERKTAVLTARFAYMNKVVVGYGVISGIVPRLSPLLCHARMIDSSTSCTPVCPGTTYFYVYIDNFTWPMDQRNQSVEQRPQTSGKASWNLPPGIGTQLTAAPPVLCEVVTLKLCPNLGGQAESEI